MNAQQKELFQRAILALLDENRTRFGLGIVWLAARLPEKSFSRRDFGNDDEKFFNAIADDLEYLEKQKLVEEVSKVISKQNRAWRLTPAGIEFVDKNG